MGFFIYWLMVKRIMWKYNFSLHWAPYPKVPQVLPACPSDKMNIILCYVVGTRRLMPPDALHPKAYCTNPGL